VFSWVAACLPSRVYGARFGTFRHHMLVNKPNSKEHIPAALPMRTSASLLPIALISRSTRSRAKARAPS
jgi:hypothetical protein